VRHQGLLLTLMASEALSEEELADTGIADVRRALRVLGRISAEGMNLRGLRSDHPDLPAHSTVAMIAFCNMRCPGARSDWGARRGRTGSRI